MENKQLFIIKDIVTTSSGDIATAEYFVDIQNNLESSVTITFATPNESETKRCGVIKLPKKLIEQLLTIPLEMQGVPIELILKLAHSINNKKGKSRLEENKEIVKNDAKIIIT